MTTFLRAMRGVVNWSCRRIKAKDGAQINQWPSAIILNLPPNPKSQALWRKFLGLDTRQYTQIVCVNDFRARGLGPVEGQTGTLC
jgi:hypothetical protein